jgi:hypothetical protein
MYAEMGNDEHTIMQPKVPQFTNPSVFISTPKVGASGQNLQAANPAITTQKFWVLNEQRQAFASVIQQGQYCEPHS